MTLVEVLVASVILGVGVAGLMFAATLGMRNQQQAELRIAACFLATGKLGEIEAVGPHTYSLTRPTTGNEILGDAAYKWTAQIVEQTEGELFRVTVMVDWHGSGGSGSVAFETLLNDYEAAVAELFDEQQREGAIDANRPSTGR